MSKSTFVDFRAVKSAVTMVQVLEHYGLMSRMKQNGDSITGACPIHDGNNHTAFRVSISKNCWNCFSQCGCGGNVLDFVAKKEKVSLPKGAATSGPTLTLIKGALKIMAWTKAKTAIVISIVTILAVGTTTLMIQRQHRLHAPDQNDLPRSLWGFAGYATPEATAQTLFWALREGNTNTFQAYLEGFTPELRMKLENEAESRGANAFAELAAHEMGGVTRYRILKRVTLSDTEARLQIQFGGSKGPVQMLTLKKIGNEWKCAGQ